jgi:hypothetical protein
MGTTKPRVEDFASQSTKLKEEFLPLQPGSQWLTEPTLWIQQSPWFQYTPYAAQKMHVTNINTIDRARKHGL